MESTKRPLITSILIGLLGLPMALMGAQLLLAGGTPFFLVAGALMSASAYYLFQRKPLGFNIYAVLVLVTLAWAVYEAGNSFWLVGSRIWVIGFIALWLCTPLVRRTLWPDDTPSLFSLRMVQICALATVSVVFAMVVSLFESPAEIQKVARGDARESANWDSYGGSNAGTRYVTYDQIHLDNVDSLERKWEFDTGRAGRFSGTPLQIDDGLYLCTAQNVVISLDADTGEERWRMDPENEVRPDSIFGNCRGVTYYEAPETEPSAMCSERIYTATTDARLIAMDRDTGLLCNDFGEKGQVSLLAGMGEVKPLYYAVTSPAIIVSGVLVVGGLVLDNQETEAPSGVVRGYNPITGELVWAWDVGKENAEGLPPLPNGELYTRGTPNVWSLMSGDDDLGLVYVPTGNATPDYFGGHRSPVMDKYASSVVAIDAMTGETRWHFQTAHHDIWDYDIASQPTLIDLTIDGVDRKAMVVPTKRAELFVLDRETGEPITEVTERAVPQTDLPEERTSATQPFSTGMPSFEYPGIREQDLFGITPFDQIACRLIFKDLDYKGLMTPPSVQGTLLYPGPAGGMNWGSVAIDEERKLMVVNALHLAYLINMVPREKDLIQSKEGFAPGYGIGGPQRGTPFAAIVKQFTSPLGLPCIKPPYGEIAVVDLNTQEIVWRRGTGFWDLGFPSYSGGSIITKGGLIFNGSIIGGLFRAIDVETGKQLWSDTLLTQSDATPMSYVSSKTGRQYVLVTVPLSSISFNEEDISQGSEETESSARRGGLVIAYSLPE